MYRVKPLILALSLPPFVLCSALLYSLRNNIPLYGIIALVVILLFCFFLLIFAITKLSLSLQRLNNLFHSAPLQDIYLTKPRAHFQEIEAIYSSLKSMTEKTLTKLQALAQAKEHLESILFTMADAVLVFNSNYRTVLANPAAEKLFNLTNKNILGRHNLEIIRDYTLHEKVVAAYQEQKIIFHELHLPTFNNKVLQVNLTPIKNSHSIDGSVIAVFHDITELRKIEQIKTDFAANVSHELRTPLTAIRGFAEILAEGRCTDQAQMERFFEIIHREAERLNVLIEDILKLSHIETNKDISLISMEIKSLVDTTLHMLGDRLKEYALQLEVENDLPMLYGDENLLRQALFNLVDNALKYTAPGGTITIGAAAHHHNYIKITVADTGIGIPEKDRERIFERFYRVDKARTRRLGGSGLGLAIVKHIVEAHGGSIELSSAEGKGTAFNLILPKQAKSQLKQGDGSHRVQSEVLRGKKAQPDTNIAKS